MTSGLRDNLLTVCRLLAKHNVQYLVVGGSAVALHGYFRLSVTAAGTPAEKPDLDFWYNPTYPNYFSILRVIEEFGEDVSEFRNELSPNPRKSFFRLDLEKFTVDFLPVIPGFSRFSAAFNNRENLVIEGVELSFISLDDLVTSKVALSREKDIIDIKELRKRNERER